MKKSNFLLERLPFYKMGFLSFLLTFLFVAGMHTNTEAQVFTAVVAPQPAGNSPKFLTQPPTGNFVAPSVAMERITNAITALKGQMAQYAEGTSPYNAAFLRYTYYVQILTYLKDDRGVAESIASSLEVIMGATALHPDPSTTEQVLAERNAAITLLR